MDWFIYILQCADKSLYTGITTHLADRLQRHSLGRGAKYTASRLPVVMVWSEKVNNKSEALKKELLIKKMSRPQKLGLIKTCLADLATTYVNEPSEI